MKTRAYNTTPKYLDILILYYTQNLNTILDLVMAHAPMSA